MDYTLLTEDEVHLLEVTGFQVRAERIIKDKSILDLKKLSQSQDIHDDFFEITNSYDSVVYSIYDNKNNPVVLEIETQQELIDLLETLANSLK